MKKQLSLIGRSTVAAIAAGALCLAGSAFAEETAATPSGAPSNSTKEAMPPKGGTAAMPSTSQLDKKDKQFMMTAAKGGMKEVHMGQMAQDKGQSNEVKKLGRMMVGDHSKANNQLKTLAAKKGVQLDTSHPMDKMDMSENFDQQWLAMMVKDHEKTISEFQAQAKNGKDEEVKDWANKTLPTLQKHLKRIQEAQQGMAKKS